MTTSQPRHYADLPLHIAHYLHHKAGFPDPLGPQDGEEAVHVHGWEDQPDQAISILGPWEGDRDSETVPPVRFMIAHRAVDLPALWELQRRTFTALENAQAFPLTAGVELRYCRRVVSDPPVPDQNQRFVTVDTYTCRPYRDTQ